MGRPRPVGDQLVACAIRAIIEIVGVDRLEGRNPLPGPANASRHRYGYATHPTGESAQIRQFRDSISRPRQAMFGVDNPYQLSMGM
jgi:hypothetical protein